jgi:hypothetical protein
VGSGQTTYVVTQGKTWFWQQLCHHVALAAVVSQGMKNQDRKNPTMCTKTLANSSPNVFYKPIFQIVLQRFASKNVVLAAVESQGIRPAKSIFAHFHTIYLLFPKRVFFLIFNFVC